MLGTERALEIDGRHISVLDYGGNGVDVLLVHTPGYCAPSWDVVARELGGRVHAYAMDLPGHGHSLGDIADASDMRCLVVKVAEALGLDRPVLVGVDFAGYYVLAIAAERPDLPRAVVSVGGFALRDRESSQGVLEFAGSEGMADDMRTRFHFGVTGNDPVARESVIDDLVARAHDDWLISDMEEGMRNEVEWSIRDLPDGSWIHLPKPSTVQAGYKVDPADPFFPESGLFASITVPTWQVISMGGQDDDLFDAARVVSQANPQVTFASIEGGFGPHYKAPAAMAELIVEAAQTP
ncbi:MAG: alpha/beta hydrolase [Dermatophilus congolensis]|nr:alpha/beta hydrolase [Dermatophilus congolensis]